jgi:3-methyladenine DNA glycosylase AlkC
MAEPLKNMYTPAFFEQFANKIKVVYPLFKIDRFIKLIYDDQWDQRELKQRIRHITYCLGQTLPPSYEEALEILGLIADDCQGFPYLFFPDFIELYGLEHYEPSIRHLEIFTQYSSAEFAIRPFIVRYPEQMMAQMLLWTKHHDPHVRRLASEGCRPRLPWGMALSKFKADPAPILPILRALREDSSEYVRKSVANNLNDITKDHPLLVLSIAQEWYGSHPGTNWIVKHACRTLLKQGYPEALALFGFEKLSAIVVHNLALSPTEITMGQDLTFSFTIQNNSTERQKIRLEYGIDFVKANGSRTCKIFKISEKDIGLGELQVTKTHRWREITTRVHYAGEHRLSIRINGVELAEGLFNLTLVYL